MIRALLALLLVAPVAAAQVVPPDAKRLTDVACVLSGCGGVGDIEAVNITTTAPITGSANCATGTCAFTLGLTGGVLSGLTAPFIPVATSATAVANSDISYHVAKTYSPEPVDGRKLCFTDSGGNITCLGTTAPGYAGQGLAVTKGVAADSAFGELTVSTVRPASVYGALEVTTGNSALYNASYGGGGMPGVGLSIGSVIGWPITTSMDLQIKRDAAGQLGVYGSGSTYGTLKAATLAVGSQSIQESSNYGIGMDLVFADFLKFVYGGSVVGFVSSSGQLGIANISNTGSIHMSNTAGVIGWNSYDTNFKRDAAGIAGVYGASTYGTMRAAIFATPAQSLTVLDSGDGSPAAATLTPTSGLVAVTCSDADGCDLTLGESGIVDGQTAKIVNASANTVNLADTAGVSELTGAIALGQYDAVTLIYRSDRWIQTAPVSNN